jgi:hypothetical protein
MLHLVISGLAAPWRLPQWPTQPQTPPTRGAAVGVSPSDVLNVRVGPGTDYFVTADLPVTARGIQRGTVVPTVTHARHFALCPAAQAQLNGYAAWLVVI